MYIWTTLQGPARYAAGIPSSMLRPAEGVETDVIEKLDRMGKTTMTAVEREAYTQGKVENVDWLRDEEEDGAGEKKVPERTEAATEAAVPPELKCPFCGDLLVAAVLLPCCVAAACDECARDALIEENHTCRLCQDCLLYTSDAADE